MQCKVFTLQYGTYIALKINFMHLFIFCNILLTSRAK